mgnify:CR=1 FL=1
MLMKGIKSSSEIKDLSIGVKLGISIGIGCTTSILLIPLYKILAKRITDGKFTPPILAIETIELEEGTNDTETNSLEQIHQTTNEATNHKNQIKTVKEDTKYTKTNKIVRALGTSLNTDIHAVVAEDEQTLKVHKNAEKFDKKAETFFVYLQIFSAFFDSVCHGSNDVANAIGPFATIFVVYKSGVVDSKIDMEDNKYWILALGGVGICLGLLLYGYRILRAIGVKLAVITPSRGFSIEMGSSLIVIIGSYNKWPLSTTHCQIGSTFGVAALDGIKGINKYVLLKTVFGWIITCFITGLMSGILFSIGAYSPSAKMSCT